MTEKLCQSCGQRLGVKWVKLSRDRRHLVWICHSCDVR